MGEMTYGMWVFFMVVVPFLTYSIGYYHGRQRA